MQVRQKFQICNSIGIFMNQIPVAYGITWIFWQNYNPIIHSRLYFIHNINLSKAFSDTINYNSTVQN